MNTDKAQLYDIYDDVTNKTLQIKAYSLEQAEGIADTIPFEEHEDGEEIDVLDDIANSDIDKCAYCNEPYVGVEYPDGTRCGNCGGM